MLLRRLLYAMHTQFSASVFVVLLMISLPHSATADDSSQEKNGNNIKCETESFLLIDSHTDLQTGRKTGASARDSEM